MIQQTVGKTIQRLTGALGTAERMIVRNRTQAMPLYCITLIGPPRIGSTLAYILIAKAFDCWYPSNLDYALFKAPHVAAVLRRLFPGSRYRGGHESDFGFVKGLWAPAEANRFWEYWFDYSYIEKTATPSPMRRAYIRTALERIAAPWRHTIVTAWNAHAYYLEDNARFYDAVLNIALRRDPVDVALSILKGRKKRFGGAIDRWFSLRPRECREDNDSDPWMQIAAQVFFTYKRIDDYATRCPARVWDVSHEALCADPRGFLHDLHAKARRLGIPLDVPRYEEIPSSFVCSTYATPAFDEDRARFARAFAELARR
jgi:hypothetical protein